VFTVLPYVWLAALAVLTVVAYLDFRKTKGGYRFRPFMVVGSVIAISMVAGVGLHLVGMGKRADAMFEVRLPQYRLMVPRGIQIWDNPQAGRLVGSVENLREDGSFDLIAPDGESWTVHIESGRDGKMLPMMEDGVPVRVVGEPDERGEITAKAVLPWGPGLESRPGRHLPQRNTDMEDSVYPARIIGERQSRPSVHPAEPFSRSTPNQYPNE